MGISTRPALLICPASAQTLVHRLLAAHEGSGPKENFQIEIKRSFKDLRSQKFILAGLLNGMTQSFNSQRIFCPHVNVALTGANGVTSNGPGFRPAGWVPF